MKKVMALVVLVVTTAQANELKKAWHNFGKDNRAISGGKALVAGYLAYASARHIYQQVMMSSGVYKKNHGWFEVQDKSYGIFGLIKAEFLPRQGVFVGLYGYAAYLFSKQAWHDAKYALGQGEKEKKTLLVATTAQANELKKARKDFGRNNRVVSGGKTILASYLGYTALRELYQSLLLFKAWGLEFGSGLESITLDEFTSDNTDLEKTFQGSKLIEVIPRKAVMLGAYAGFSYYAFKQAWHDAKHALGKDKKEEQISE